jgi:hypothetical protein
MRKSRFSETEIVYAVKQVEMGISVKEIAHKYGGSENYEVSECKACKLIELHRSVCRYESCKKDDRAVRMRLKEPAYSRPRYGYRRLTVLLQREGWPVSHKRVYRIYGEEGLLVRTKLRRGEPRSGASDRYPRQSQASTGASTS